MNANVISLIEDLFGKAYYNVAYEMVNSITTDSVMANCEINLVNTQCAVLKISNGDIIRLKDAVAYAKTDFRDVLLLASKTS